MSRTTVVYLGGFGRSGSTLIERALGSARGWTNVGELVDLARSVAPRDERCGCGRTFSTCPTWTRVGEIAFGGWTPAVLDRLVSLQRAAARQRHLPGLLGRPRRAPSPALRELRESYALVYAAVAEVSGAEVVVDASKGPALGQALSGAPGIDLRMLNVVRDPRAVAWSWNKQVERPHATSGSEQMWRIPAHRSAAQWGALQLEMQAVAGLGGVRSARLRYEDFVVDPVSSVVTATRDLGLALTPADLPHLQRGRITLEPSHGLSGNPTRFRSGALDLRTDDSWVTQMPSRERALVTAVTLPLLRTYHYPTHRSLDRARHDTRSSA